MTVDNPQNVIFIDSRVPDIQDLLDGVKPGELVFVLDPDKDGVQQIADILAANNLGNLSTISIVSHGAVGEVTLGSTMLTEANLAAHAAALAEIGAALGAGGTLQLFGCDVGLGAAGQQFVNDLAMFAGGINVAAATHDVGSAALGGSWTLDVIAAPGTAAASLAQTAGSDDRTVNPPSDGVPPRPDAGPAPSFAFNSDGLPVTPVGSPQSTSAGSSPASNIPFTQQALNEFSGVLANPVQTELWITASGGGPNSELIHVDDNGGASSINNTTLWTPTSANRPTQVTQVTDVAIDPTNQFYFISQANTGSGSNVIYKGSIAQELSNPSGTPTLTAIFTQTGPLGGPSGTGFITQLALDPDNQQIYWSERHSIVKANYDGSAVTTLATGGSNVFADGLALDLPHSQAFFFSTTTFSTFAPTTGGGSTFVTAVDSNAIYVDSNLSATSVVTPTKLTMSPDDSFLGGGDFPVSLGLITGIAVDSVTEKLYFTTQPVTDPTKFSGTGTGGIYEYDLTGNPSHTYHAVWVEPSSSSLFLTYIHIDNATNSYYVTDVNPTGGGIYKGNLSSTLAPTLFTSIVASTVSMSAQGFDFDNAPSLTVTSLNGTFTESTLNPSSTNNTPVSVISGASVTDTDDTKALSATVSVGGFFTGDVLSATTTGTSITSSYNSSTGVLTLTGVDTLAHYQSVLASVTFTSTSENPTDYGSDTSRTLTFSINDGLLASAPQTATVTVVGVDDAPTLAGTTNASFTENGPAVTLSSAVSISDPDSLNLASATVALTGGTFAGDGDVLAANTAGTAITASYNAATETLTLTGSDTFAHYQQVLDSVTFVTASENPTDFGADPTRTVTWTLNDGGAAASVTSTVSITAVNDAPTLSSVATSASYTEQATAVTLAGGLAVTDPDSLTLAGATVHITGGTFAGDGDVLAADVSGTSITASYNAATETLILSGTDTVAHYQGVLDSVTFFDAGDNPTNYGSNTTRSITWQVTDGSASNSASNVATTTLNVTAVNDAPTLSGTGDTSFTENGPAVTLSGSASVSDPDSLTLAGATVALTGGTFAGDGDVLAANTAGTSITASYNAATETLILSGSDTLAHYQQVLDSVTFVTASENPDNGGAAPTRTVTWTLDDGSASNATSSVTTTVTIAAVNDAPTLSGTADASFTENGAAVTLSGSAAVSDPDSLTLAGATVALTGGTFAGDGDVLAANTAGTSITASYNAATETLVLSGSDTLAHYQQVLDSVTFVTASDNPDDFGADPTRTVTWTLDDGSASNATTSVTTTVSITAANDAPTLSGTANASFTENGAPVTLSGSASVSDPDSQNLVGATVALTGGTFAGDGDVLAANVSGTSITASYNAATETLVLSGSDTLAHYQQVLDSVTFVTASDNPDNGGAAPTRTVTWTLDDGSASNATTSVTTTVSITAVNDAPTVSAAASASYTEQAAATTLSGGLVLSDPDSLTLAGATVALTGGTFAGDGDVLAANVSGTNITASYNAATETLILSGTDTVAHYQSVLDSVTFFDAGDNPTNYGSNATRVVTWVVTDGSASNGTSTAATTTLNVTAVNDAPTLAGVPSTVQFSSGDTLTVAPTASASDPDNLTLANATVQVTGGTFAGDGDVLAANVSGTSITASYNAVTETLTLSGSDTLAHYQQVLDSVTFTSGGNPTNFGSNPTRTLSWVINDGSGSNNTATATTTISISAPAVKNDFNGDHKSDILFQASVGLLHDGVLIDFMNGTTVASQATLPGVGPTWSVVGSGDFNADGKADILWQNIDGTPLIWTMDGSTITSTTTLPNPGIAWDAIGTGDFNGDGKADILFQNSNGTPQIWTMNGTSVASTATLANPGSQWQAIETGDFNGDGKADIVFQKSNGTPMIWEMNGTSVIASATLPKPSGAGSWKLIGTGDFNGDGDADLLFQKSNGTPMIWTMNGTSVVSTATLANPGASWHAIGTGDYNADGKADILFQNSNGTPLIWTMNGTSVTATATLPNPGSIWHANTG